jgi:hypothetical protein
VPEEQNQNKEPEKTAEAGDVVKRGGKPRGRLVAQEQAISPQTSYWPFVLAFALAILLLGIITHPVIFGIGVVLTAVSIIGWGLERR